MCPPSWKPHLGRLQLIQISATRSQRQKELCARKGEKPKNPPKTVKKIKKWGLCWPMCSTWKMDLTELKRMEATKFNLGFIFSNLSFPFPSKKDLFNEKGRISAFYLLFAFVHRISFRYISIQEDIRRIQFLNIHEFEAKDNNSFSLQRNSDVFLVVEGFSGLGSNLFTPRLV